MVMFREIHKNTWLKRLTAEGKKITIGPKKSERSWVVFCVHDDTEALLEGYADPRQAPSHNPEWIVPMQDTLHISHALIPNSHEFEFVVTLSNEVVRFHAMSWDIMQEWVETLRSKLREMKILSPRENLYTKLPEIRAPLLPTRDPTSPLPAPPPVPAALVPGVERVIPPSSQTQNVEVTENPEAGSQNTTNTDTINSIITSNVSTATAAAAATTTTTTTSLFTSMSNTLTQNLLNMLSDPISAYSEQINDAVSMSSMDGDDIAMLPASGALEYVMATPPGELSIPGNILSDNGTAEPLLRSNYHPVSNTNDFRNLAAHRFSADQIQNLESILQCECHIPRPQTSRSLSVGAADKSIQAAKQPTHNSGHLKQTIQEDINHMEQRAGKPLITNSKGNNVTELEVNAECDCESLPFTHSLSTTTSDSNTNITIIQVSTAENDVKSDAVAHENAMVTEQALLPLKSTNSEIFTFSDLGGQESAIISNNIPRKLKQHEYKSNVQIIPSTKCNNKSNSRSNSCNSTTVQIMGQKQLNQKQNPKITTVHVAGNEPAYGTCFESMSTAAASSHNAFTPKMSKKIILSSNAACITNITVNTKTNEHVKHNRHNSEESGGGGGAIEENQTTTANAMKSNSSKHYEKVFLSSSSSVATLLPDIICDSNGTTITTSPKLVSPSQTQSMAGVNSSNLGPLSPSHVKMSTTETTPATTIVPKPESSFHNKLRNRESGPGPVNKSANAEIIEDRSQSNNIISHSRPSHPRIHSPALARRRIVSPLNMPTGGNPLQLMHGVRPPFVLKRGLTEAVITSRPSRRDFPFLNKIVINKKKSNAQLTNITNGQRCGNQNTNNNTDSPGPSVSSMNFIAANRLADEAFEQRRRSSSTSDANHEQQQQRHGGGGGGRGTNNNELSSYAANAVLRSPPQQQQFSLADNGISSTTAVATTITTTTTTTTTTHSPAAGKRMSLREQQVMQLRREIMHPGGVRLQLRRKDCVGSIAWVDVFGAVWVAGWKQKEHPVLYNALHIGDQLLSVAGMTINSANEANKIIRNTNTLFVEVLVRRIPMGRGYAIRRDRECQCLGLIRDGNTATIVDVIPNSLAARHGLPPKAQSFDGTTLTCWMLTEINGRPLNLFFKDNEIRDRLNSVGRDISILVQPSDLITKLKKQLKSLRGYKEYLVQ